MERSVLRSSALLLACAFAFFSCSSEPDRSNPYDPERNKAAPAVISTDPEMNGINGDVTMTISAQFNTWIDDLSVTKDSFIVYDSRNNRVMGRISCEGTTVTFKPVVPLFNAHKYTAVLTGVIRGISGIRMPAPHVWSFTTALRHVPETVDVPGGAFDMGTATDRVLITDERVKVIPDINPPDEKGNLEYLTYLESTPVHEVTVSDFLIGKYEVTFDEYDEFCDSTGRRKPEDLWGRGRMPVINITWFDAVEYCNWLSDVMGYDRCYTIEGMKVTQDVSKNGFRLPTEAEWEYAARSGGLTPGHSISQKLSGPELAYDTYAWCSINANSAAHEAGSGKEPNDLGIYDMSGNVAEWCWDWYAPYTEDAAVDPVGPADPVSGDNRKVTRGGGYLVDMEFYATAIRGDQGDTWPHISASQAPGNIRVNKDGDLGFRISRRPCPFE